MLKKFFSYPILFIVLTDLLLFLCNVRPATNLIGWDGLYPQLNFPLNLSREIFGVWQARGLGMWDGMSHASNLIHTLFLVLMSLAIPTDLLRYSFIFGMHAVGMIGMYILLSYLFKNKWMAFFGGLFYGLNLISIQMFFAPLEVFAIHFAFLPILTWSLFHYLSFPKIQNLLFFALFSLLATPQGYVPQIFVSYCLLVTSILFVYFLVNRKKSLNTIFFVVVTVVCANAFWLLPYSFGIPHNAPVIMNSKINQMASNRIYLMNQYRGDLLDVLLLKGFMLDMTDVDNSGNPAYIMQNWRAYTSSIFPIIPSFVFAFLTLFGLVTIIKDRKKILYPFVIVFLITGFFLGNNIPFLNLLNALIRWVFPIFNEAFRFPFTKFSTLFVFCYTIFLSYGVLEFSKIGPILLSAERDKFFAAQRYALLKNLYTSFANKKNFIPTSALISLLMFFSLLISSLPAFTGHFLYDGVRVRIEPDYQQVISFFTSVNPTARIATLPQPTFYNWEYHQNGYRGSGFLWYALPQSMMERSFDPWSSKNEQFYWEFSQAIYSQNPLLLQSVLHKYQIAYVLLDENRIYPFSPESLNFLKTKDLLMKAHLHLEKTFGKVDIYTTSLQSMVFATSQLPSVNPYSFTQEDLFALQHGNYISSNEPDFVYPLRSLFTSRNPEEKEFSFQENLKSLTFSGTIPPNVSHMLIPSFIQNENLIPATFTLKKDVQGNSTIYSTVTTPVISIGRQKMWGQSFSYPLFTLPKNPAFPLQIRLNGQPLLTIHRLTKQTIRTTLVTLTQDNVVTVTDARTGGQIAILSSSDIRNRLGNAASITFSPINKPLLFSVTIPKVTDNTYSFSPSLKDASVTNCNTLQQGSISSRNQNNGITLSATLADACLSFYDKQAFTSEGYVVLINHSHKSGQPLNFWAEDISDGYAFSQVELPDTTDMSTDTLILPPMQPDNLGYSFHFDNTATGNNLTQNTLSNLSVYPIPFTFLQSIEADSQKPLNIPTTIPLSFDHPNPSLYTTILDTTSLDNPTLVLSQAYDNGWNAYAFDHTPSFIDDLFPFLFGQKLTNHVIVNNWENGWNLQNLNSNNTSQSSIVIVFLPQYLEYTGFVLLLAYWIWVLYRLFLSGKSSKTH